MKTISRYTKLYLIFIFLSLGAVFASADWEPYGIVGELLTIKEPGMPVIYGNSVIFTADSGLRRVGVAFAHENFSTVYWYSKLIVPQDFINPVVLPGQKIADPYKDSGIQFFVYQFPDHLNELEYRIVINGLWTIDTTNPLSRKDPVSGLNLSVLKLPSRAIRHNPLDGLPEGLNFVFYGPPGEIVTIAGNFNAWDPFMFELKEETEGTYKITIPLPSGTYQYLFYHRGQRFTDPTNPRRVYARDGTAFSEIVVP